MSAYPILPDAPRASQPAPEEDETELLRTWVKFLEQEIEKALQRLKLLSAAPR